MAWKNSNRTKAKMARAQSGSVSRAYGGRDIIKNGQLAYMKQTKDWHTSRTILDDVISGAGFDKATTIQVKAIVKDVIKHEGSLTEKSLVSRLSDSNTRKLLVNVGLDEETAANELGVTVDQLDDQANWRTDNDGKTFFSVGGRTWQFVFSYTESVFRPM